MYARCALHVHYAVPLLTANNGQNEENLPELAIIKMKRNIYVQGIMDEQKLNMNEENGSAHLMHDKRTKELNGDVHL